VDPNKPDDDGANEAGGFRNDEPNTFDFSWGCEVDVVPNVCPELGAPKLPNGLLDVGEG
jgi:hypothetical protein